MCDKSFKGGQCLKALLGVKRTVQGTCRMAAETTWMSPEKEFEAVHTQEGLGPRGKGLVWPSFIKQAQTWVEGGRGGSILLAMAAS